MGGEESEWVGRRGNGWERRVNGWERRGNGWRGD